VWHGQKTYNGVALLARSGVAIDAVVKNIPGFADEQARVIAGTVNGVRVVGGYFPNGQAPDSDKFVYKMGWLDALQAWLATELQQHPQLVLMGDFNIAPEDRDVFDPVAWAGQIHCTPQERAHFQALLGLGLVDAFRLFEQPPKSWSWWDYRNLAFRKNQGLRIDHVLVSAALKDRVQACSIDKAPRKLERPSDHAPVLVDLALP
jgi:exodeoxyribonuclease III